jgi:murein L,D-transpeptidase YcbB/YkuD
VEDPFRMAEIIFDMEQKDILRSQLDTLVAHEKTKNFKLNKKVNVHQVYFTAVIDDTEQIKILNDVYSLDNILYRRLIQ